VISEERPPGLPWRSGIYLPRSTKLQNHATNDQRLFVPTDDGLRSRVSEEAATLTLASCARYTRLLAEENSYINLVPVYIELSALCSRRCLSTSSWLLAACAALWRSSPAWMRVRSRQAPASHTSGRVQAGAEREEQVRGMVHGGSHPCLLQI
jgi:hypothetical protein